MIVRLSSDRIASGRYEPAGCMVEMPDAEAHRYLQAGYAVRVEQQADTVSQQTTRRTCSRGNQRKGKSQ